MRNLFSYILLISLLSPTVVEAFHAITDSHEIHTEENTNVNQLKVDCQINLLSNQEDDVSFFSEYSYELLISQNCFYELSCQKTRSRRFCMLVKISECI